MQANRTAPIEPDDLSSGDVPIRVQDQRAVRDAALCSFCMRHPVVDDDESDSPECAVCHAMARVLDARLAGLARRYAALAQEARELGFEDEWITWAADDAADIDPDDAAIDATLHPEAGTMADRAQELRMRALDMAHADDAAAATALHTQADDLLLSARRLVDEAASPCGDAG